MGKTQQTPSMPATQTFWDKSGQTSNWQEKMDDNTSKSRIVYDRCKCIEPSYKNMCREQQA